METCAPGDRGRDGLGTAEGPHRRKQRNSRMCVAPHLRRSAAADANETTHVRFVGTDGLSEGLWARNVLADRDRQDHELSGHLLPKGRAGNNACGLYADFSTPNSPLLTRSITVYYRTCRVHSGRRPLRERARGVRPSREIMVGVTGVILNANKAKGVHSFQNSPRADTARKYTVTEVRRRPPPSGQRTVEARTQCTHRSNIAPIKCNHASKPWLRP